MSDRKLYGYVDVVNIANGEVIRTIDIHFPFDSSSYERFERGFIEQMDCDRFFFRERPLTNRSSSGES